MKTLNYLCINHGDQRVFLNVKHHKCLSWLFALHLNTCVMSLRPLHIFCLFQCGDSLYTSESDVCRCQIPTYKDGPHAERLDKTRGRGAMARAPDCLASHVRVPRSNPAVPMSGFQRNIIVSPFSM